MISILTILLIFGATVLGAIGSLYMKKGSGKFNLNPLKQMKNKNLILGIFFFGISSVVYVLALKRGNLSIVYPLTSLTYVWISLLSVKFLNEKMNVFKWSGIALIMMGISLIALFS
jgi:uncharacterized membrane protein